MGCRKLLIASTAAFATIGLAAGVQAQDVREFSFGYDQPKTTGYGFAGDLFEEQIADLQQRLDEDQPVPGRPARPGAGDAAEGALRRHRLHHHLLGERRHPVARARRHVAALPVRERGPSGQGDRLARAERRGQAAGRGHGRRRPRPHADDARVPQHLLQGGGPRASTTSRARRSASRRPRPRTSHFPAYGAQPVHMPFGEVYTSLQTGVVDMAENSVNVYLSNKHYEVAPVMSFTQHEANNNLLWVSDKTWQSLSDDQKAVGRGGRRRGRQAGAAARAPARAAVGGEAQGHRRQDRRGRRQVRVRRGGAADPGSARRGARPERGRDRRDRPRHQIASRCRHPTPPRHARSSGRAEDDPGIQVFRIAGQNPAMTGGRRARGVGRAPRLARRPRRRGRAR